MSTAARLLIIDGFNLLYRSFHGNEPLTGPLGQPTGAIHGFLRTLNMLQRNYPQHNVVITLDPFPANLELVIDSDTTLPSAHWDKWHIPQLADLGEHTSRWDLYPQYKSTRSEMPQDLRLQLAPLVFILHGMGIPMLQGNHTAEADDLLATLATEAKKRSIPTVICSGDKDVLALIDDSRECIVYNPNVNKHMTEKDVLDKYGVTPSQMEDFLALMGDSVDNIPGVQKCGPKTAAKWLNEFKTLEEVIANSHTIKGVVGDNLRSSCHTLPLSRALTALKRDLPLDFEACVRPRVADHTLLKDMYVALGMKSMLAKMQFVDTTAAKIGF